MKRVFWRRPGQKGGALKERSKEQSLYQQMVQGRGRSRTSHALVDREPGWEQLPEERPAEIHRSEDVVHALRVLRQVLLQIGIAAASCEMTMLWCYCAFVI